MQHFLLVYQDMCSKQVLSFSLLMCSHSLPQEEESVKRRTTTTEVVKKIGIWLGALLVIADLIQVVVSLITSLGLPTLPILIPSFVIRVELSWLLIC